MRGLEQLVIAAQSGDHEAFGQIVARFQDMAYATSFARLGDHHLAQDAAQEAFLEAYLNLSKLKDPAAFPGWFRQIVFRQCHRQIRGDSPLMVPLQDVAEIPSDEPTPSDTLERQAMDDQVYQAILSLPPAERVAIVLFYIRGHSQKAMADFLGVPLSTIKKRLHSARNRLKKSMLDQVRDTLQEKRPSRDRSLRSRVRLSTAALSAAHPVQRSVARHPPAHHGSGEASDEMPPDEG